MYTCTCVHRAQEDSNFSIPEPDKYRGCCSQPTIGLSTEIPMKELEKGLKELKVPYLESMGGEALGPVKA